MISSNYIRDLQKIRIIKKKNYKNENEIKNEIKNENLNLITNIQRENTNSKIINENIILKVLNINTFFDKIYVINLDERKDRWIKMEEKLKENNIINFVRFSAINGYKKPLIDFYRKLVYFFESPGAFGIILSIIEILKHAITHKYKSILILEDDIIFHKNFNYLFESKIKNIPNDWKLLFLGCSMHEWRYKERCINIGDFFIPKGSIPGAFSLGIKNDCFILLINELYKFLSPWDLLPIKYINTRFYGKCYVFNPNIIIADVRDSNIRKGKNMELKAKQCCWNLKDYNFN